MISDNKQEKIGNITLDYAYYPGEDYYSEGAAEDALLDLVSNHSEDEYDRIIQHRNSWSVMYHLSHIRENVTNFLPISKTDKVLEIGSGCGAITGDLARRAKSVTCIELSKKRSTINATRHKDLSNVTIKVGNFEVIEPILTEKYDVITLIGVLEYANTYLSGEHRHHMMLNRLKRHLAPGGKIIIAIENRLGLKYFAGCKEDHTGTYFKGIEGYDLADGVRTFSKPELNKLITECGLYTKFYYPYPDYKLPGTIYSDDKLPEVGELNRNMRNFDNDRFVLFDEQKAFDTFIQEGDFQSYSNSFIVICTQDKPYDEYENVPVYTKYSDERLNEYRMATQICKSSDGLHVYKRAGDSSSKEHVNAIKDSESRLKKEYDNKLLRPNSCTISENGLGVEFEFLKGITLEKYIDELEKTGDFSKIETILKEYVNRINNSMEREIFTPTDDFVSIFGNQRLSKEYESSIITNFDMIFSNLVVDKNGVLEKPWDVLDYEWVFTFSVPIPFIIYRALFYQFEQKENSAFVKYLTENGTNIYSLFDISEEEREIFKELEHNFQRFIIGNVASLEVMQVLMPTEAISLKEVEKKESYLRDLSNPKIYFSTDGVFIPENRINLFAKVENKNVTISIPIHEGVTTLRIDPTEYNCMLYLKEAYAIIDDKKVRIDSALVNGYPITDKMVLYNTDDAQIIIENIDSDAKEIILSYKVTMYEEEFFAETLKKCEAEKELEEKEYSKLSNRVLRKLGLKERCELMPGFYKVNL